MTTGGPDIGFNIDTHFIGHEAILMAHGEVDISTAPQLGSHLDHAIDSGHLFVLLDLADVAFMDGAGLHTIEARATRLMRSGGSLTIRSPSAMVSRLIEIVGVGESVRVEQRGPSPRSLDPQWALHVSQHSSAAPASGLAGFLRMVAAIPPNDELVNSALRLVVALAQATVDGADGVSVSLRRHGRLSTVAASDQIILDMDASQYETGEGPCIDASVIGRRFHTASLEGEGRWPSFTPTARALGINAILSSPLQARHVPVGALNIYSRSPSAFADKDQALASLFADEASLILSDVQADVTDSQLDSRLGEVLRTRELISQAQGVIMERDGIGEDDAYTTLRHLSLHQGRPLRERAQEIVNSTRLPRDVNADVLPKRHHD